MMVIPCRRCMKTTGTWTIHWEQGWSNRLLTGLCGHYNSFSLNTAVALLHEKPLSCSLKMIHLERMVVGFLLCRVISISVLSTFACILTGECIILLYLTFRTFSFLTLSLKFYYF